MAGSNDVFYNTVLKLRNCLKGNHKKVNTKGGKNRGRFSNCAGIVHGAISARHIVRRAWSAFGPIDKSGSNEKVVKLSVRFGIFISALFVYGYPHSGVRA